MPRSQYRGQVNVQPLQHCDPHGKMLFPKENDAIVRARQLDRSDPRKGPDGERRPRRVYPCIETQPERGFHITTWATPKRSGDQLPGAS